MDKINIAIKENDPLFSIGVVADMFGVSVHTLRLYEREGLILPHKSATNRRFYSQQDIHRIQCIRDMIDKKGLNISGIKAMLAMVPCWEILPCTEKDREKCEAYYSSMGPCWSVTNVGDKCKMMECRDCHVYQSLAHCNNFKEFLKKNWK